jgi:hypothetical protein
MAQNQIWNNCHYFDNRGLCPAMKESSEVMRKFASAAKIPESSTMFDKSGIESRGVIIDELFCNECSEFKSMI